MKYILKMKFPKLNPQSKTVEKLKILHEYEDLMELFEVNQIILKHNYEKMKKINETYSNPLMKSILYFLGTIRINNIEGLKTLIFNLINNQRNVKDRMELNQIYRYITCSIRVYKTYSRLKKTIFKLKNRKILLIN
jgi:hypothetical protein